MKSSKKILVLLHPKYWPVWLGLFILWLIIHLPLRWQINFGAGLGKLLYIFPTQLRRITETNIQLCFPEMSQEERDTLAKQNFRSLGIGLIEAAMGWWLPDKKLANLVSIDGLEYVEAAFQKGKGIVLIGPHFTCLELIGRALGMNYKFAVMYSPHKKPMISFIHEQFRGKHYTRYIPKHRVRDLIRALNENMAIWYAYDIDGGDKRSVFAPFFGIQTASLMSTSRIVEMTDAAVIPIYFYRDDTTLKYRVVLLPPIENFPTQNAIQDATILNQSLEYMIRQKPEQYVWQYKRFKTRPPGEKRFY